jgi:hypothetical protein
MVSAPGGVSRWRSPAAAASLLAAALAFAPSLVAQQPGADPHAVQPERPTVATHAGTVAPGWIEFEIGGEFDRYGGGAHGVTAPLVAKLGVAPRLQLTLMESVARPKGASAAGIGDVAAGLKWRALEDAPVLGDLALLPIVKLPAGSASAGTGTGTTDVALLVISSHTFGSVALDINAGYTRRSGSGANAPCSATVWTVSAGGPLQGSFGWTAEVYGYPATSGPAGARAIVALLGGPTLLVRKWLALDAGVILPLAGPQPRALYVGAVYNAGRLWGRPGPT